MDTRWGRVGTAVRSARNAQGLTQAQLGELIGVSGGTIRAVERGQEFAKVTTTLRALERVLGWGSGSIEAILAGTDPLPPRPGEVMPTEPVAPPEGLPLRVARALAEGTTLDARVVPLGPAAEMVVVIKGKPAATPDEIRAALLAWERQEGHLDRLGEVADDTSETS